MMTQITDYNKGRSNGLRGADGNYDTWETLYYDFFKLKASIDTLKRRSDKIQDYILGMLNLQIQ